MKKQLILSLLLLTSLFVNDVKAEEKYPYIIEETPVTSSKYLYFENSSTGQILLENRADEQMYPASMTKVMTCLVALDNLKDLDQEVTITYPMVEGLWEMNASVAGLNINDTYTVMDLLYAAMLPSGADAVRALALTVSGSIFEFTELMNAKAQEIGMNATQFRNVDGLHNDEHYSNAKDLSLLLKEALKYPVFREVSSSSAYTLSDSHKIYSSLFFFAKDEIPGLKGGKTGFTGPAGRCLMSYGTIRGNDLILVTGGAGDMGHISDAKTIYSWYENEVRTVEVVDSSKPIASIAVSDTKTETELDFYPTSSYILDIKKDAAISEIIDLPDVVFAPLKEDQVLGTYEVYIDQQLVYREDLKATEKIERNEFIYYLRLVREFIHGLADR